MLTFPSYTDDSKGVKGLITALAMEITADTPTAPSPSRGKPKKDDKGQVAAGDMTTRRVRQKTITSKTYTPYCSLLASAS